MGNTFWKFLLCFLVALLVFGAVGIIIAFAVRDSGAEFAVEYNGDTYYSNTENQSLCLGAGEHGFSVKYFSDEHADYTAKVVAVADSNFAFAVDGKMYQFYGTDEQSNDYSEIFNLQKTENGFSVTVYDGFDVEQAVREKFDGNVVFESPLDDSLIYFQILVISGNYSVSIPICFELKIEIDPPSIIF